MKFTWFMLYIMRTVKTDKKTSTAGTIRETCTNLYARNNSKNSLNECMLITEYHSGTEAYMYIFM